MTSFTVSRSPFPTFTSASFSAKNANLPTTPYSPPSSSPAIPDRLSRCSTSLLGPVKLSTQSSRSLPSQSPISQRPFASSRAASSRNNFFLQKAPRLCSRSSFGLGCQLPFRASFCIQTVKRSQSVTARSHHPLAYSHHQIARSHHPLPCSHHQPAHSYHQVAHSHHPLVTRSHYPLTHSHRSSGLSHRRSAHSHRQFEPTFQQPQRRVHLGRRWCEKAPNGAARRKGLVCRVVEDRPAVEGEGQTAVGRKQGDDKASEKGRGNGAQPGEPGGLARLGESVRDRLSLDDLWWEILVVSFPALLALAADPVASLFETSLLGNLGPAQLAAAGVSINVFNTLCKLFNFPLLNVTTSFVAEAETQSKLEREELLRSLEEFRQNRSKSFQSAVTAGNDRPSRTLQSDLDGGLLGEKATAEILQQASNGLKTREDTRSDESFEEGLRERRASGAEASTRNGTSDVRRYGNGREVRSEGSLWTGDGVLESSEYRVNSKRNPTEPFGTANLELNPGHTKPVNTAVSASIIMGAALGIVESLVLGLGARNILGLYGTNTEMMGPASMYLALRAIGAPALVVSLAVSGAFRGFGDTKTPLYAQVASNVLNVALLPLFMFTFGWGIAGAAAATVTSQYVQMTILLVCISRRCQIMPRRWQDLKFRRFLGAGGVLLGRTLASLFTMSLATSMAARTGTASMAAHQICIQVWLAASLLSDSVALAGQTILARAFVQDDVSLVDTVAQRIMKLGLLMGGVMAAVFLIGRYAIPLAFTHDPAVLAIIASLLPFIVLTQPINALAFVWDGLHYGASDFVYSAQVMVLAAIPAMAAMYFLPQHLGIAGVWVGLTVLMSVRALLGVGRYATKSGPWEKLKGR